jgi:hypothetical protein
MIIDRNKIKAFLAHVTTVASFVLVANDKLKELPFTPPAWVTVSVAGLAAVAGVVLHFLPKPGLEASPTEPNDQDEATAKAAGAAGSAASKGPFVR